MRGNPAIAIERCEALAGAEQEVCKEQADASLEAAMDRASTLNP
jgi:hypothetical protein